MMMPTTLIIKIKHCLLIKSSIIPFFQTIHYLRIRYTTLSCNSIRMCGTMVRFFLFLASSFFYQIHATKNLIDKLVLYDTSSNPGVNLGPIVSGMVIDLETTGKELTILAQINSTVIGYVYFKFDDTFINKENFPFYALNGNSGSFLKSFAPLTTIGEHTIVADFYSVHTNELLDTSTTIFNVIDTGAGRGNGPITGFALVNTVSGSEVTLPSVVDLNKHGKSLSIVAYTRPLEVDDIVFLFDNKFVRVELSSPWAVNGNEGARIFPFSQLAIPGVHTVTAIAQGFNEEKLGNLTFTFTVQDIVQTQAPLRAPIQLPTTRPTLRTGRPTLAPIRILTSSPSLFPVKSSQAPSMNPTPLTSVVPTQQFETAEPTGVPATKKPSSKPTTTPTISPLSSVIPTQPIETVEPTESPTFKPTKTPTLSPTQTFKSKKPALQPTIVPSSKPSRTPTNDPTSDPTSSPLTSTPSSAPERKPSSSPQDQTKDPTSSPLTSTPSSAPKKKPSSAPQAVPSPVKASISPVPTSENVVINGELKKWHKVTLSFTGPYGSETSATTNPFMDYRLDVTFTHVLSQRQYIVPGYFAADGNAAETSASNGTQWHCHFSPDEIGFWRYDVSFMTGKDVAVNGGGESSHFDGVTGLFDIMMSDKIGRDHRGKGRLRYVGAHHLQFAEGEWFLKAGADSPENFLAYEDFDNTPNTGGRRKTWDPHTSDFSPGDPTWQGSKGVGIIGAVNYLSSEGMNVFSFLTMNINGDDENVFPFISDLPKDRLRIDVSKLAQWEIVFEHADKMGMYLHFKLAETENDQLLDGGLLGNERKLYYRELIARFGHHLALNWNLSEEISNPVDKIIEFADYFKETDPYNHLVLFHAFPNSELYTEFLGYPSIDGASLQDNPLRVFSNTLRWVLQSEALGKKWIVSNDEQSSANDGVLPDRVDPDHDIIRINSLWGNIMAGGAGVEYYFGYGYEQSDLTCEDFRSRANMWKQSRYALSFFRENNIPFWAMSNDNSRLPDGSKNWVLSSDDGDTLIVYRKSIDDMGISLVGLSGRYSIVWFNPREGGALMEGSVSMIIAGGTTPILYGEAPGADDKDWVVLIRRL